VVEATTDTSPLPTGVRLRFWRPTLPKPFSMAAVALLAVSITACGGSSVVATPECYLAQEGQIVGATGSDCEPPDDVEVLPTPTPTPAQTGGSDGRVLFITLGCATCHELDTVTQSEGSDAGPALNGINAKGADYIRESILNPSAEVVEGYVDGLMPQDFETQLTPDELDTLVTFLSSQ